MPHKTRSQKQKGFSVWLTKRKPAWVVGFSLNGERLQERIPKVSAGSRSEDVERAAAAYVATRRETEGTGQPLNALAEHADSIRARSRSHRDNCARYEARLKEFFNKRVNPCLLEREDLERWRDWLLTTAKMNRNGKVGMPGLTAKSVAEHLHWLNAVRKRAGVPVITGVRIPRKTHDEAVRSIKYFTPEELRILFDVCRAKLPNFYNALVFLVYSGCRAGELSGLTRADLDEPRQIIYVTGKGQKRRPLRLSGPMQEGWNAIQRELVARPGAPTVFFPAKNWASRRLGRLCDLAFGGTKHMSAHACRHSFASMALQHFDPPWDMGYLAKWLGHADVSITYRIYSHWLAPIPQSGPNLL